MKDEQYQSADFSPQNRVTTREIFLRVGVIGMGKLGPALAAAFSQAGHHLLGVVSRCAQSKQRVEAILGQVPQLTLSELIPQCDLVVFSVQDRNLPDLIKDVANQELFHEGQLVAHTAPH